MFIRVSWNPAVLPHPLIIVRIVHNAFLYGSLGPAERGLALNAPHLVASVYFGNAKAASGTRSGILPQFLHCVHILLFANVVCLLSHNCQKTFGTREFGAYIALVLGGKHATTPVILALHHEFFGLGWTLVVHFSADAVILHIKLSNNCSVFADLRQNLFQLQVGLC
jgi:hypothetical protein